MSKLFEQSDILHVDRWKPPPPKPKKPSKRRAGSQTAPVTIGHPAGFRRTSNKGFVVKTLSIYSDEDRRSIRLGLSWARQVLVNIGAFSLYDQEWAVNLIWALHEEPIEFVWVDNVLYIRATEGQYVSSFIRFDEQGPGGAQADFDHPSKICKCGCPDWRELDSADLCVDCRGEMEMSI